MSAITVTRILDLEKTPGRMGLVDPITLRRGESGLTDIELHVVSGGVPVDLADYEVTFFALNAEGGFVRGETRAVDASKGVVAYTVDARLTAAKGAIRLAYFELSRGEANVTTGDIPIVVMDDVDTAGFKSGLKMEIEVTSTPESEMWYEVSEAITYRVIIANNSSQLLKDFELSTNYGTLVPDHIESLSAGSSTTAEGSFTPTLLNEGSFITITVIGENEFAVKEASTEKIMIGYKLSYTVDVRVKNRGTGIDGAFTTGDEILLEATIVNDGNVDINNLEVTTDLGEIGG